MTGDIAPATYGLMAEFEHGDELVAAVGRLRAEGYTRIEAYTPQSVEGLSEALNLKPSLMPKIVAAGAIAGALAGYGLQYYVSVIDWQWNIGGRPLHSWPAFIPITFELAVLFGSLAAFVGMLALNGLPRPYHPVFNVPRFAHASRDRFFLVVRSEDERFDADRTRRFLERLEAHEIAEVPE
ncbi:MAG TPA: DUF3341 domain-containing protein [Bryobacteraceae bacterium]|nr:DUF3341 domain-containing protein [Bryobacteraceae bacterium]